VNYPRIHLMKVVLILCYLQGMCVLVINYWFDIKKVWVCV